MISRVFLYKICVWFLKGEVTLNRQHLSQSTGVFLVVFFIFFNVWGIQAKMLSVVFFASFSFRKYFIYYVFYIESEV